jgi:hypothetical protein
VGSRRRFGHRDNAVRQNNFSVQSVAWLRPMRSRGHLQSLLAYVMLYPFRESRASQPTRDDIAPIRRRPTVTTRQLLKEIVMRNFIFSLTLFALGVLQIAIVVAEFSRV